ncbi:unnamed protein product [Cuscuta epithymum]|uniref:AAA+ ATPase domain-containing protein n=1 Tax=Cuscuta epithymum TaxID=186058 RepID=A0AAV0DXS4_9ASTE|nr:unnamed protein product [Cuscuta epithymum]
MSSEMRRRSLGGSGGGASGGVGNSFDPSNLHLKRELTHIKKAAKALRDPGTTSSWRSPLGSARSTAAAGDILSHTSKHHYSHHHNIPDDAFNIKGAQEVACPSETTPPPTYPIERNGNPDTNGKEKEKKVFLYNWRSQKSESERSRSRVQKGKGNGNCSTSSQEESIADSLSDARHGGNDSKSDTYVGDRRYASIMLKCNKDTNFMPSIRRNIKKKSKKNNFSTAILQKKQMASANLVNDQSEDTEDYSNSNAEDFRRLTAASPLLARLRNKKKWAYKLRNSCKREDSSYSYSTPALSTSSYNRYGGLRNPPSRVGSWDGTTQSFNDGDDEVEGQLGLPGRHGCGISCWSMSSRRSTPKCYSPSLSDTLRMKKGSTFLCGTRTRKHIKRRHGGSQGLIPLLTNGGSSMGTASGDDDEDDELSTNFGEIDLEALSRLDGRSRLDLMAFDREEEEEEGEGSPENIRSFCQKYRPTFFEELIGQNIVVQSLMNSVSRGRIAPVYILQGPRGTGKTSTARIFAAALNCVSTQEIKPCGGCRECADFISMGKCRNLNEVDGTNKKGIDKLKYLLKTLSLAQQSNSSSSSGYKVFVIDECHLLPSKTWLAFLKFLEEPPPHVVFMFVTTDLENVPRAILSRCQKYIFNKIRDSDIVTRLKKIVTGENLDAEPEALELIALNADGSLRDAETMLDQLSLLGKRITTSLVNDLVGVVSDEKLLELLELAISSDTAETVKRARELLDMGVDPIVLMSQLAALIMDIIAGTLPSIDAKPTTSSSLVGKSLSEMDVDRLRYALKLLSEAEKQLRVSSERSTWFTATLLQLGSAPSPDHQTHTHSGSSRRQSSKAPTEEEDPLRKQRGGHLKASTRISASSEAGPSKVAPQTKSALPARCLNTNVLDDVWVRCIQKCHSNTLKQLLLTCGTLISISEIEGVLVAHVAFRDNVIKTRVERFLSSITNSFENVLRRNVDVRLILLPEGEGETETSAAAAANTSNLMTLLDSSPKHPAEATVPAQRIESIIREQRLETAWLQAMEKGATPGPSSLSRLNKPPERNQVLPQDNHSVHPMSTTSLDVDELHEELKNLRISDEKKVKTTRDLNTKRVDHCPISPSLLHGTSGYASINNGKDNMGYESGTGAYGCSQLLCWNNTKVQRGKKMKQGTPVRPSRSRRLSWIGECAKGRGHRR